MTAARTTYRHYTRVTIKGTEMTRCELVITDMDIYNQLCQWGTPKVFGHAAFLTLLNKWNQQVLSGNDDGNRPIHVYVEAPK